MRTQENMVLVPASAVLLAQFLLKKLAWPSPERVLIEPYLKMTETQFERAAPRKEANLRRADEKLIPIQTAEVNFIAEIFGDVGEMRKELVVAE